MAQQLTAQGARLIADYGSFQIMEVSGSAPVAASAGVRPRPELNWVMLNSGTVDTSLPSARVAPAALGAFAGQRLRLVQFAGPIKPEWRQELEAQGGRVVAYIPYDTYLVYGDAAAAQRLQALAARAPHIQWEGPYEDAFKIHPRARSVDVKGRPREIGTDRFAIQLVADAAANATTVALLERLALEPFTRSEYVLDYFNVVVRLSPAALELVAAQPEVISIMPFFPRHLTCERQAQIMAGNLTSGGVGPSGPGYLAWLASKGFTQAQFDASGFVVDVSDSGVDNGTVAPNHFGLHQGGDLAAASRVVYNRLEGSANAGSTLKGCDGHGTLNSHIIGGYDFRTGFPFEDASGYNYGLGVCPFVKVGSSVIFDPNNFTNPNYRNLQSRAYQSGARISNNSWGGTGTGDYDIDTQIYDALVRDAQPANASVPVAGNQEMVIVFAAGNDGPTAVTIGPPGTGKNILSVGASENVQAFGGADSSGVTDAQANNANDVVSFSSRGPCADGRHKPDLMAPGTHVSGGVIQVVNPGATGQADPCFTGAGVSGGFGSNFFPPGQQYFTASSGTSHATPGVAGGCALLRQYFINQSQNPPSPAMTKAWLMNAARYLNGANANDTLPSDSQGMGAVDLGRAFDGTPRVLRDEVTSDTFTASGQELLFTGHILDSSKSFRVTLAWTDAPGNTTGNSFNNDLDLVVEAGGKTYLGNVFSGATSVEGGTADSRDNVESVFLPAGLTGTYSVRVRAANINSDGVPNVGGSLDQDFALVIYNADAAQVPRVSMAGSAIVAENCAPGNGVIDSGETVTVTFSLQNTGLADTTNLVATLLATNGVVLPSAAQVYGAVPMTGAPVDRQFTFTAAGACGAVIQPTLLLQDGPTVLGLASARFILGQYVASDTFAENFDGVTAPAFPASWLTTIVAGGILPVTSTTQSDTAPNSIFFAEPDVHGEAVLVSPSIPIVTPSAQLSFTMAYDTEIDPTVSTLGYDGGVLEIKIGKNAFVDILSAGGSFASGGYTRQIDSTGDNPLAGRQGWCGASGGFTPVVVNLPAAAAGNNVLFKWRFGTDTGNFYGGTGMYLDSLKVTDGSYACCQLPLNDAGIVSISRGPSTVLVSVLSSAGATYVLEYKNNLLDTQWASIAPPTAGTGGLITLVDPLPGSSNRFYRVRAYR